MTFFTTLLFVFSFIAMEIVAWFTHKFIMHGVGWKLHETHHVNNGKALEHNDWFSLLFAIPSWLCIMFGLMYENNIITSIGAGMTAYGFVYFIVHDVFIHQRLKLFRNTKSPYLSALRRAHKMHHRHQNREHGESFGFLWVQKKYFKTENNSLLDKHI
ncbi:MAG: sterol desaturase family protein [Bacteroidota bacterium]|nr:sterol desaturase family protein [Bacteroidota bacterium]